MGAHELGPDSSGVEENTDRLYARSKQPTPDGFYSRLSGEFNRL